jgi:hypothetical protein
MNIENLLPPRLRDWYNVGPTQRAELDQFVEKLLQQEARAITADGVLVTPNTPVWVLSSTGKITQTRVLPLEATTDYYLFGNIPVSSSFSTKAAAQTYKDHAL